jgi:quinolinate synthetase A subunit
MLWQASLPDVYLKMSPAELAGEIAARRRELGDALVILGHHYQTDEIIQHADFTGDSLKLSQIAARISGERPVRWIVFCGVHFMAETADMLTPEHVSVILPDMSAGCSMADMAQYEDTVASWDALHASLRAQGWSGRIVPITYVNSSAAIKAFVGANGGACCTSSNALEVIRWALGSPPLRGGSAPSRTFGLQPCPDALDTLDPVPMRPVGLVARDPYPPGASSPRDLREHRRELPHPQLDNATYFVTWKAEGDLPLSQREMTIALDALTHVDGERCRVYAANVMTTHVHWVVRPFPGVDLADLCESVKRISAAAINTARGEKGHVWVGESFDHIVRDAVSFRDKVLYTVRNPVIAGVCSVASEYEWTRVHSDCGWEEPRTPAPEGRATTKVLFLPDQHLGRNTAHKFGVDVARESCVYDPRRARAGEELGGATAAQVLASRVILWAGHCSVHKLFRPEHCDQVRAGDAREGTKTTILVHPECCKEVVDKADLAGSTEFIFKAIREAPVGSRWAVGTEVHLVTRLAREAAARGVHVRILSDCQCLCTTMYRIDQPHLLWVVDNLAGKFDERAGTGRPGKVRVVNEVRVHPEVRKDALVAVERMLKLAGAGAAGTVVMAGVD